MIAVRSLPPDERLDSSVAASLEERSMAEELGHQGSKIGQYVYWTSNNGIATILVAFLLHLTTRNIVFA